MGRGSTTRGHLQTTTEICLVFFDYRQVLPKTNPHLKVHYLSNEEVHIPKYARGCDPVEVTAAVHYGSDDHHMYREVLSCAVNTGNPSLVYKDLEDFMFPPLQWRFRHRKGMKLLPEAAADLERHATDILAGWDETQDGGRQEALRRKIEEKALEALCEQRKRERSAIATCLHKLCRVNFGDERVPALNDILSDSHMESRTDTGQKLTGARAIS